MVDVGKWDLYWLCLIVGWFAFFLPPEIYSMVKKNGHTLSEHMWRWEHLNWAHPAAFGDWTLIHWAVAIFFTWLTLHFIFGIIR